MKKEEIKRANADVGVIITAYNLRLVINIIGVKGLIESAKKQLSCFLKLRVQLELRLTLIRSQFHLKLKSVFNFYVSLKQLYLNFKWAV